jgi:hypothetical protein
MAKEDEAELPEAFDKMQEAKRSRRARQTAKSETEGETDPGGGQEDRAPAEGVPETPLETTAESAVPIPEAPQKPKTLAHPLRFKRRIRSR